MLKSTFKNKYIRAFTLIELLVVISIIGMLSSVVLVSLSSAREKGRIAAGITFATHTYRALGADAAAVWKFNEGSGFTSLDESGNNSTFNLDASVTWAPSYNSGGYSVLTSNNGASTVSSSGFKLNPQSGFSTSFWINTSDSNGSIALFYPQAPGMSSSLFELRTYQSVVHVYLSDNNGGDFNIYGNKIINDSKWHNIAISAESINNSIKLDIYVDGKLDKSTVVNTVMNQYYTSSMDIEALEFTGYLDDFFVYNRPIK